MNKLFLISLVLFLYCPQNLYSKDSDEICDSWRREMDRVTDLDGGIAYCKKKISEVSPVCRTYVYLEMAGLYFRTLELN